MINFMVYDKQDCLAIVSDGEGHLSALALFAEFKNADRAVMMENGLEQHTFHRTVEIQNKIDELEGSIKW